MRLCGAELVEVPAVPYANPNNYVRLSGRLADQLAKTEPNGAIWANQFDNVANRDGHIVTTGPRNLAADRRQGRRLHLRGRHRRHARGRRDRAQGAQRRGQDRPRRSDGRIALQLLHQGRAQGRRLLNHRRHRPKPRHQEPRRCADRHRLSDPGRRSGADHLRPAGARRSVPRRLVGHQRCAVRSGWPRNLGPGTRSSRSSPTTARATCRSCSTRNSCARRICRSRPGWSGDRRSKYRTRRLKHGRSNRQAAGWLATIGLPRASGNLTWWWSTARSISRR